MTWVCLIKRELCCIYLAKFSADRAVKVLPQSLQCPEKYIDVFSIADPHWLYADPDPPNLVSADPDPPNLVSADPDPWLLIFKSEPKPFKDWLSSRECLRWCHPQVTFKQFEGWEESFYAHLCHWHCCIQQWNFS